MPEISRFFGIVIRMYFDDHNPPHFHAMYAGDRLALTFADGTTKELDFRERIVGRGAFSVRWRT